MDYDEGDKANFSALLLSDIDTTFACPLGVHQHKLAIRGELKRRRYLTQNRRLCVDWSLSLSVFRLCSSATRDFHYHCHCHCRLRGRCTAESLADCMTASEDEEVEVFSPGASPELRRSSRTSARKRASTESAPYTRPKSKKKMQTVRSPVSRGSTSEMEQPAGSVPHHASPNPFASLGATPAGQATMSGQGDFLAQMQTMMGGMLGGMETRLNKTSTELRVSVDQALTSINDLNTRVAASEKRVDKVVSEIESMIDKRVEAGLKQHGLPVSLVEGGPAQSVDTPVEQA